MKSKLLLLLTGGAVFAVMASMTTGDNVPLSNGAPIGSTNAPGELSCGKAGCHTGSNNINTGQGVLSITSQQDITSYTPGATYDLTVSLDEAGIGRFGFSLTALDGANQKAGTLIVTDQTRTQVFPGAQAFAGREYMTYRAIGTNPYGPGKGQWSFKWKAPDQAVGPITFYTAALSGNNDGTDDGDLVYTKTLVSNPGPLAVTTIGQDATALTLFPNPARDHITLQLNRPATGPLSYGLYDVRGRLVRQLEERTVSADGRAVTCSLNGVAPGVYYLRVRGNGLSEMGKVFLAD